jgi:hypothetical protein
VTIQGYKTNQAAIEGQYIGIRTASLKSGTWPAAGANGTVYLSDASTGATDSLAMFIDLDTDIDGSAVPTSPFDVLGVATQFQATGQPQGTPQIQPSARADFRAAGTVSVDETTSGNSPETFALHQNYPNPFNPTTSIKFELMNTTQVSLKIYNLRGELVATLIDNESKTAGAHTVTFDARSLTSGVYFYKLETDAGFVGTRKLLLLR